MENKLNEFSACYNFINQPLITQCQSQSQGQGRREVGCEKFHDPIPAKQFN